MGVDAISVHAACPQKSALDPVPHGMKLGNGDALDFPETWFQETSQKYNVNIKLQANHRFRRPVALTAGRNIF